jgi:hypothetical protein
MRHFEKPTENATVPQVSLRCRPNPGHEAPEAEGPYAYFRFKPIRGYFLSLTCDKILKPNLSV